MDGLGARAFDGVEDGLGVEVGLGGGLATEGMGLVGQANVEASRSSSEYTATVLIRAPGRPG